MTKFLFPFALLPFLSLFTSLDAVARSHDDGVHASIVVNASARACWDALRDPCSCPDNRKIISSGDGEAIVEETFENLPMVHTSTCVFKESETPFQRIDYKLVKSSSFKKLEGSWVITPVSSNKTLVEIHSCLDTGIHLPFAHKIANDINERKCKERLVRVKTLAESSQRQRVISRSL